MSFKILVATDGSPAAERAVTVAADIAKARAADLVVLVVCEDKPVPENVRRLAETEHVVDAVATPPAPNIANVPTWMADGLRAAAIAQENLDIRKALAKAAAAHADEILRAAGVGSLRVLIEEGDAAAQIIAVADREQSSMIVMGSRGLGSVETIFQGSVSRTVTDRAICPCVTVT